MTDAVVPVSQEPPATPAAPESDRHSVRDALGRFLALERNEPLDALAPATAPEPEPAEPEAAPAANAAVEGADAPEEPQPEQAQEPEPQPVAETAEVEIDGQKYIVPTSLKDGYLRQADYTKKTTELAERSKVVDTLKAATEQAFQVAQALGPMLAQFEQARGMAERYQQVDWATLERDDPQNYLRTRLDAQDNWTRFQNLSQQLQQAPRVLEALQQQTIAAEAQRNLPRAKELVPDLDQRKGEFMKVGMESYGFSAEELGAITDPRIVHALRDLADFHKQKATKAADVAAVRKAVQAVPPVNRPGARTEAPQVTKRDYNAALRNMRTDRSDDAIVNALRMQRKMKGQ